MVHETERPAIAADWYRRAFGALYPIVYSHRTVEAARPEARFAAAQIALHPGDRVLDLCCGNGRHMVHFVREGADVTGLDYSPDLLTLARRAVGHDAHLVRADMRALPFENAFDVVVNFFTSFGYFVDPEENERVVCGVARALKPGGRLFLDYLNASHVRETLVPGSVRHSGDHEIRETRWIDQRRRRVNKSMAVWRDGTLVHESSESVQLYDPDEFRALIEHNGLCVDHMFGDYAGAPLDPARPRMIVVGHKA